MPDNDVRQTRRVAFSSFLGSAVEFYDFLLYGAAASLVFNQLFFTRLTPLAGTLASFATLAIGYLARPLGGIVFGHFGDRLGRKSMLMITMSLMGLASFCIGLLPTYDTIGLWAPTLLVVLRLIQGVAVGGEWGGAALMAFEHAPARRRGLAASFANMGGPAGSVLATTMLAAFSALPEDAFLSWGWRVPFLFSVVLLAIGLFVRLRVAESPAFQEAARRAATAPEKEEVPLLAVLRRHPKNITLAALGGSAPILVQSLLATFMLTYAMDAGYDRSTVLAAQTASAALHILTIPAYAALSDRVGRKPVMIGGAIGSAIAAYPLFALVDSGSVTALYVAYVIGNPLLQAAMYGPMAAFVSEMFGTRARYTGASLGYQLATTLGGGLAPLAATALLAGAGDGKDATPVVLFLAGACLLSAVAVALTRETNRSDLEDATFPAPVASAEASRRRTS
ncbi:MFS transporter [Streptomyces sp. NPDC002896]|uniref:MFS transporter n=1 Tax=Streptomyces sp. NPDC002896 TaxID=3154438 RepID=UPI0033172FED